MTGRLIVTEDISDATNTCACDACGGDPAGCEWCYRGRLSGWHQEESPYGGMTSTGIPCDAEQRAAVDHYLDDCDRECQLCPRRIPTTSALPICPRCEGTARVAGDQANWARQVERGAA